MPPAEPTPTAPEPVNTEYQRNLVRPTLSRRIQWRLEVVAYALIEGTLGILPARAVARAGRVAGAVAHLVLSNRRRTVTRNLRIALAGEIKPAELAEVTKEVFKRAGANLLSSLRTARLGDAGLAETVSVVNLEYLNEATAAGRGVLAVLAHMGNWEAIAQWCPVWLQPGQTAATVYRPLNNPIMNARMVLSRARRGVKLFSKDDSPLAMASHLRAGGLLGVLSDQRAGKGGELVSFFGRLTSCSPIPSVLARRTGAAVLGVSLRTLEPGRWELKFHKLEGDPTTQNMMGLLERMLRESMTDVFWLQDRWRIERRSPHKLPGKAAKSGVFTAGPTKRRRALLWADANGVMPVRPVAEPADLDYEAAIPEGGRAPTDVTKLWIRPAGGKETAEAFLARVDAGAELPLEFVVAGARDRAAVREACRRLELGFVEEATK